MPIERWMRYEQKRLDSFTSRSLDVSVAQRLAKAGFYCSVVGKSECFSCGLWKDLKFWEEGRDPETVHHELSPDCEFIKGQSDNVLIERWMRYEQKRLDTFDSMSLIRYHRLGISVRQRLAKAGFYHWGFANTECFSCGLCKDLYFWEEGRDPETVHRALSPDCKFIKGQSDNVPIDNELQDNTEYSIEENTSKFTCPELAVKCRKVTNSSAQKERLISATRGSCASPDIVQSSLTFSQSSLSSDFSIHTVTEEYVTSVDTSERNPTVSLSQRSHLTSLMNSLNKIAEVICLSV